jgi:hypothetical protein
MATRRVRMTISNKYTQPLKVFTGRKLVITPSCDYNCILYTLKHKSHDFIADVWARSTEDYFELCGWLEPDKHKLDLSSSASCYFKIYEISNDALWTKTLVDEGAGVSSDGKLWTFRVLKSDIGYPDGESTFFVEVELARHGERYRTGWYFNHLGVYDSIVDLRKDIAFLAITKKDI